MIIFKDYQKKVQVIFLTTIFIFAGLFAESLYKANPEAIIANIVESTAQGITLEFNLPQVDAQRASDPEFGEAERLIIPSDKATIPEFGVPDVSVIFLEIRIPVKGSVEVATSDAVTEFVGKRRVLPLQKPQLMNGEMQPYVINTEVYNTNAFFPEAHAAVHSIEILRDIRVANIMHYPIKVNPVTNDVVLIKSMKVKVQFTPKKGSNELNIKDKSFTKSFLPSYRNVMNFEANYFPKFRSQTKPGCYLFIGNSASLEAVEDLINWKIRKGYEVKTQEISSIGSSASALDSWIEEAYSTWENKPEFILFCGAEKIVPTATKNRQASDHGFACIGTSKAASIHIGRVTAKDEDMESLTYQAWKFRMHDMDPYDEDPTWMTTVRTWGSKSPNGIRPNERIAKMYEGHGFTVTQDKEGQNPKTGQALLAELNKGLSMMSYIAHGSSGNNWSNAKLKSTTLYNDLANGRKTPWIWNIACTNGRFTKSTFCVAEGWMCAGSIDDPQGAISMISYSVNATTMSIPMFEWSQKNYFVDKEIWHMGACLSAGKKHIKGWQNGTNNDLYGVIYFGDPEIELYLTKGPLPLIQAEHNSPTPATPFKIKVQGGNNDALEGAMVGVCTNEYTPLASGFTDASGELTLEIPAYSADTVFVTATYHNHRVYLGVIDNATAITNDSKALIRNFRYAISNGVLKFKVPYSQHSVSIRNLKGQNIYRNLSQTQNSYAIPFSSLAQGVHFLTVNHKYKQEIIKFSVVK